MLSKASKEARQKSAGTADAPRVERREDGGVVTLRLSGILDPAKINYGVAQNLEPPYVSVQDFSQTTTYDTGGPRIKDSTYRVVCVARAADDAEELAQQVNGRIEQKMVTPNTMNDGKASFQEGYKVGQMAENLFQFGVEINYSLKENVQ